MMAYPYYPYNPYQPQSYLPQNYQQVQQTPVANQSGIIWVSGEQEAAMYPIAPNNAVALWDRSGKTVFIKQADATGKPSMKTFDLVERGEVQESAKMPAEEYATKKDLAAILADIETMRSDLYGVAGRKRSVKKTEVTEDDE